ncbi:MAG TPA: hypothetical protein VFO89_00985, partial [Thermoanaerobaculia bacterium]|nr:hypothetical protein [Thermoanaerobaculia bacterium]
MSNNIVQGICDGAKGPASSPAPLPGCVIFFRHPVVARLTALTTGYTPCTPPACTCGGCHRFVINQ